MNSEEDGDYIYVSIPPDGGYGWFVTFTAFLLAFVVDGITGTFGLYITYMEEDLGATSASISLAGSLQLGFYCLVGPIAAALANRFGFQCVVVSGSIVGALALVAAANMPMIELIWVTYGVIGGFGLGMCYIPSIVIVGLYFERWRAMATCLASIGSGAGLIALSTLFSYLLATVGWRNTMMIQGGTMLLCILFGLSFRPIKPRRVKLNKSISSVQETFQGQGTPSAMDIILEKDLDKLQLEEIDKGDAKVKEQIMFRDDLFYEGSLLRLPEYEGGHKKKGPHRLYHFRVHRIPYFGGVKRVICPRALTTFIGNMLDFSLFKSPTFVLQAVSSFLFSFGYFVPYMYLPVRATLNGMTQTEADLLLTALGISNVVARLVCGIVASIPKASVLQFRNSLVIIGGVATMGSMLHYSNTFQYSYVTIFGFAVAGFTTLRSIILADTMGLEKLSNGFGLLNLFQGVAIMIGTPLAGILMTLTGNYNVSFWYAGGLIAMAGVIMLPLNFVKRKEQDRKRKLVHR